MWRKFTLWRLKRKRAKLQKRLEEKNALRKELQIVISGIDPSKLPETYCYFNGWLWSEERLVGICEREVARLQFQIDYMENVHVETPSDIRAQEETGMRSAAPPKAP